MDETVLEGVFAVAKPANISSADVLQNLQTTFAPSATFAPLLRHQPKRPSKGTENVFRMGHGGTLDSLASGVLIVGIGRGTKHMQRYLACTKSYETTVLFGACTDTYDCTGEVTERGESEHVTKELVGEKLGRFRGQIMQAPPVYSALKIDGMKACEYVRSGKQLPRQLEKREVFIESCDLLRWYSPGDHAFRYPGEDAPAQAPAASVRLTVSSGFYVRSFAHDLGLECGSRAHMVTLDRTRQGNFALAITTDTSELTAALTYEELDAGEEVWGPKLRPQLEKWVEANPVASGHVDGRNPEMKRQFASETVEKPRQRFRGGYVAETKKERIKQQGGKYKGKWGPKLDRMQQIQGTDEDTTSNV
ncbi:tRNA pseudouridine synthase B [Sporormia fimetaria CBS 119925]|uniref:tRNA pseudouridine(55) synthase n=1 Tax=Sporormia fimetaria CBS 119925 TaxID=1340428 RepID=A0A6A6VH43_9PLEO|nr:tRNA pseudouridine synthase B [Sporormia fimetaria CBS 119925]